MRLFEKLGKDCPSSGALFRRLCRPERRVTMVLVQRSIFQKNVFHVGLCLLWTPLAGLLCLASAVDYNSRLTISGVGNRVRYILVAASIMG